MNIKELATALKTTQALTKNLLETSGYTLSELNEDQLENLKSLVCKLSGSSGLAKADLSEIQTHPLSTIALENVQVSTEENGFNDRFSQYISMVRDTLAKESSAIAKITEDYPLLLSSAVQQKMTTDESKARLVKNAQISANELMVMFNQSRGL